MSHSRKSYSKFKRRDTDDSEEEEYRSRHSHPDWSRNSRNTQYDSDYSSKGSIKKNGSSHRESSRRDYDRGKESKSYCEPLLDIDFSSNRRNKHNQPHSYESFNKKNYDDDYDNSRHSRREWRGNKREKERSYSDSDEDYHGSGKYRSRERYRSPAESYGNYHESGSSRALIVSMPDKKSRQTRKLMTKNRPVSLLDLPTIPDPSRKNTKPIEDNSRYNSNRRTHDDRDNVDSARPLKRPRRDEDEIAKPETIKRELLVCKNSDLDSFLIVSPSMPNVSIYGRTSLTVIKGSVSLLGCKLKEKVSYDVFSPSSNGHLTLFADTKNRLNISDVKSLLLKLNFSEDNTDLDKVQEAAIAVVKFEKLESPFCDYLTTFMPYNRIFTPGGSSRFADKSCPTVLLSKPNIRLALCEETTQDSILWSDDYQTAVDKWTSLLDDFNNSTDKTAPVLLTCGAKNAGKSIFNRFAINNSLEFVKSVAYLDCDVGQTEFSPPATLSLTIINEEILAPPFCNQRKSESMVFFGDATPSHDPSFYVNCLKFVLENYKAKHSSLPLIINTMGFPEGIGLMIFVDTMNLLQPDLVIQLESFNQAINFPAITQELVAMEEGWTFNKNATKEEDAKERVDRTKAHELVLLSSLAPQRKNFTFKLQAGDLRNLSLLAHLSLGLQDGDTLATLPPYVIPYNQLAMHVYHHKFSPDEVLYSIDASLVALCCADLSQAKRKNDEEPLLLPRMPVCECFGLGVVRAIDREKGLMYIVTTVPREQLYSVNTLVKGAISIPDQLFLSQTVSQPIPYVDRLAPSAGASHIRPRARMPRITLSSKQDKDET